MQIIPGILVKTKQEFEHRMDLLISAGLNKPLWVQVDFIDGVYADNQTIVPTVLSLEYYQAQGFKFEAHIMAKPETTQLWIDDCLRIGFDRIMPQIESLQNPQSFLDTLADKEVEAAVSLDEQTTPQQLSMSLLSSCTVIQVMTITIGFSGQTMKMELLDKVRELANIRRSNNCGYQIEVDGGVNQQTIGAVQRVGTDLAEVNSGLFADTQSGSELRQKWQQLQVGG